jgi:hypothetical protein
VCKKIFEHGAIVLDDATAGLRFTALLHHVTIHLLRDSFYALKQQAAPGVDGVTWKEYEAGVEGRLAELRSRLGTHWRGRRFTLGSRDPWTLFFLVTLNISIAGCAFGLLMVIILKLQARLNRLSGL